MKKYKLRFYDYNLEAMEVCEMWIMPGEKAYQDLLKWIDEEMTEHDYFDYDLIEI